MKNKFNLFYILLFLANNNFNMMENLSGKFLNLFEVKMTDGVGNFINNAIVLTTCALVMPSLVTMLDKTIENHKLKKDKENNKKWEEQEYKKILMNIINKEKLFWKDTGKLYCNIISECDLKLKQGVYKIESKYERMNQERSDIVYIIKIHFEYEDFLSALAECSAVRIKTEGEFIIFEIKDYNDHIKMIKIIEEKLVEAFKKIIENENIKKHNKFLSVANKQANAVNLVEMANNALIKMSGTSIILNNPIYSALVDPEDFYLLHALYADFLNAYGFLAGTFMFAAFLETDYYKNRIEPILNCKTEEEVNALISGDKFVENYKKICEFYKKRKKIVATNNTAIGEYIPWISCDTVFFKENNVSFGKMFIHMIAGSALLAFLLCKLLELKTLNLLLWVLVPSLIVAAVRESMNKPDKEEEND